MKSCFLFFGLVISLAGFSQSKFLPEIKNGTSMAYLANVNGQDIPVGFKVDSMAAEFLRIIWSVEGYGEGTWIMNKKSLQSATGTLGDNPQPGVEVVLPDDKIQLLLSRDQFSMLTKDKKVKHNDIEYNVVPASAGTEFKLADKAVDVVYLESADKSSKIWVLNNAAFPLLVKVIGNVNGPDLTLLTLQ